MFIVETARINKYASDDLVMLHWGTISLESALKSARKYFNIHKQLDERRMRLMLYRLARAELNKNSANTKCDPMKLGPFPCAPDDAAALACYERLERFEGTKLIFQWGHLAVDVQLDWLERIFESRGMLVSCAARHAAPRSAPPRSAAPRRAAPRRAASHAALR